MNNDNSTHQVARHNLVRRTMRAAGPVRRSGRLLASLLIGFSLTACAIVPLDEYGDPMPVSPAEAAVSTAIVTFGALHFLGALGRHRGDRHWGSRRHGQRGFDRGHRSGRGWGRGHRPRGSDRGRGRRGRGWDGGPPSRNRY